MTRNRDTATEAREFYRTYAIDGNVTVNTGTARFYTYDSAVLETVNAYVATAPVGSTLNIRVNKNGSSAATLAISAGATSATSSPNLSFSQGDYVTVDITQIGSSTAGADLRINFTFRKI